MHDASALRPLGVGDIVDRVIGIYRQRPLMFLTIAAIPQLALYLLIGLLAATFVMPAVLGLVPLFDRDVLSGRSFDIARFTPALGTLIAFLAIVVVAAIAVSLVQSAALVAAMAARYLGRETTIGEALGLGLRRSFDLFVMGLLAFLAVVGMWVALVVLMVVVRQWWIVVVGIVGLFVGTVYLTASWMVSPAVCVLENVGPVAALRRSWSLSTGGRWRIVGLVLLLLVLQVVLSSLLSAVLLASFAADQVVQIVVQQAVNLVATIAWAPIYWGTFAILYYDLRVRREAFDLQMAAEALPRAT